MSTAVQDADARWFRLAPLSALPRGQAVQVDLDGRTVALFHTEDGLRAVGGICPHAGGPLSDGDVDGGTVTCPWHRWRYDLRTGERRDRRGQPVDVHPTRVVDDWIWLGATRDR